MGDGSLKEPHSYVQKGDELSLRISHLEPEKRRVGFTQRWGTEMEEEEEATSAEAPAEIESSASEETPSNDNSAEPTADVPEENTSEDDVTE